MSRIKIYEYGKGIRLNSLTQYQDTLSLIKYINDKNNELKETLSTTHNTLTITNGTFRAERIAGIIRLAPNIELEIIPKFLHEGNNDEWKSTLYFLSTISKYGEIISSDNISSDTSMINSLYEISARIIATEFIKNYRNPIRKYRKVKFSDYTIDGEIDFDSFFDYNSDGYLQSKIVFDKNNPYNSTIKKAISILLPYIHDDNIREILTRASYWLGKQGECSKNRLIVPAKYQSWNKIYNLSYEICLGLSNSLSVGSYLAPGFVVNTWKLWEWLITTAVKIGSDELVISQKPTLFGYKQNNTKINVYPDISVYHTYDPESPYLLIDAKYKDFSRKGDILRSDMYEAFAFCKAAGCNKLILVYPMDYNSTIPNGYIEKKATYNIQDVTISAIEVNSSCLTSKSDIFSFSQNFFENITKTLD